MDDRQLSSLLAQVSPKGRLVLRGVMRANQNDRDEFASALLHEKVEPGRVTADLIDLASLRPEVRRQLARVLGELETRA